MGRSLGKTGGKGVVNEEKGGRRGRRKVRRIGKEVGHGEKGRRTVEKMGKGVGSRGETGVEKRG